MQPGGKGGVETGKVSGKSGSDQGEAGPVSLEFESVPGVRHDLEYDMNLCDAIEGVPDELVGFGPRHAEAVPAGSDAPDTRGVGLEFWGCHRHSKYRDVCRCHLTVASAASEAKSAARRVRLPRLERMTE